MLMVCLAIVGSSIAHAGTPASGPALAWTRLSPLPEPLGLGGPFAGVSRGALIVAGGAHFPVSLFEGGTKVWRDYVFVLEKGRDKWRRAGALPRPLAYGAAITAMDGLICIGGGDAQQHYADVFLLKWSNGKLDHTPLPSLPRPCAFTCAALVGHTIYVAGGTDKPSAATTMNNVWTLDLSAKPMKWRTLEPWPGPSRMLAAAGSAGGAFYLFAGCELYPNGEGKGTRRYLTDAYRYRPGVGWARIADLPRPAVAAPSPALSLDGRRLLLLGGDDGANASRVFELKDNHPGFRRDALAYDTVHNTWAKVGDMPASHVTTSAAMWNRSIIIPSGEIRPGVRSPTVWSVSRPKPKRGAEVFIEAGKPKLVRVEGKPWKQGEGYIEGSGYHNFLFAGRILDAGDFHVTAKLALMKIHHTAASFMLNNGRDHWGLDGYKHQMFVQGRRLARKTRYLEHTEGWIQDGKPFQLEAIRKGSTLRLLIDGKEAHKVKVPRGDLGMFGFRPWRSTMRVYHFSVEGNMADVPAARTQPIEYTIPIVDLSRETQRQVVIARGTADVYQGHPTTVLMADGKTMFAVWTYDHGGHCGPMKKSLDAGLTWSDLIPVPENWTQVRNCPTIHRLKDPQGVERLFVYAGNGDMYQSVSEDQGATWSPMATNGLHCVVAPITIVPIAGNRLLAHYHRGPGDRDRSPLCIWQSTSSDGGFTWTPERIVGDFEGADPCEPAIIRSPDGKQLACICRENRRRYNSLIMFSNDEGETWSPMREVPAALTGDRHMPRYAANGRLVMAFRDTCAGSPTKGDFVGWVGTYEDLVEGREGQCRLRLIDSPKKGDLGYPGLERLPDGTFVATTYAVLARGEKNSVVSVRFKMKDVDRKARLQPKQQPLFEAGKDGCHTYRIPALVRTTKGTLLAICEGRRKSRADHGDIDLVMKRSFDDGATWAPMQVIHDDDDHTIGNPCPVVDASTGTIWLPFCRDNDRVFVTHSEDDGATWAEPREITADVKKPAWKWYATGPTHGIQLRSARLLIPCDHRDHSVQGDPLHSHVIYSDDHGATWKLGGVLEDKTNECVAVETADGSVYMNMRSYADKHRRAVAWSQDGGLTWSDVALDDTLIEPVCQASAVRGPAGAGGRSPVFFSNPASEKRVNMVVRASHDECKTWTAGQVLWPGPSAYSDLCTTADGQLCCLYERGDKSAYETITFARFGVEWVEEGM